MTAPGDRQDSNAADMGSTAQFQAFVANNDDPDEARERAAADPDGGSHARATTDSDVDDREIRFSDPVPPVQSGSAPADAAPTHVPQPQAPQRDGSQGGSLRPDVELPPAELGSTAQFQAFASGEAVHDDSRAAVAPPQVPVVPTDPAESLGQPERAPESVPAPALPPADPSSKRTLLVAIGVLVLVVIAVVLLFILV